MLSFELSVIDLVLIVAVIILLLFHLARTPNKLDVESKIDVQTERSLRKRRMKDSVSKASKKKSSLGQEHSPAECSYHFGYLSSVPTGEDSIPEECYNCSLMMRCLFSREKESV